MAVSGLYRGRSVEADVGPRRIELRVDIDVPAAHLVTTNAVSADVFVVDPLSDADSDAYLESWIVESPAVRREASHVGIRGAVKFWERPAVKADMCARINLGDTAGSVAEVTLTFTDGATQCYRCTEYAGSHFRELELQVDVCRSVAPLRLPVYRCGSHAEPAGLVGRDLTIESAWAEAGIRVTTLASGTIEDPEGMVWSNAELLHAADQHFRRARDTTPSFSMWGLLAGRHHDKTAAGMMFGTVAPHRQGFTVFRNHEDFNSLALPDPQTQPAQSTFSKAELDARRLYLFTWMHEMGHAFNLKHSRLKALPKSLSWMNEPLKFDGAPSFFRQFRFAFDPVELAHLRHGNRREVIMGGNPFMSGSHLDLPPHVS